jgi:hypothetical protein
MVDIGCDLGSAYDSSYDDNDQRRVSSTSKINFTKLSRKEQQNRFKNMQKKIQRLQIQLRSLKIHNKDLRQKLKERREVFETKKIFTNTT